MFGRVLLTRITHTLYSRLWCRSTSDSPWRKISTTICKIIVSIINTYLKTKSTTNLNENLESKHNRQCIAISGFAKVSMFTPSSHSLLQVIPLSNYFNTWSMSQPLLRVSPYFLKVVPTKGKKHKMIALRRSIFY